MKKILLISTGGTWNKIYNPLNGNLEIDKHSKGLLEIASCWLCTFEIDNIIGKDSLEMTNKDRETLKNTIKKSNHEHIIVIHGTDTMDITAQYLADSKMNKSIVLTGAMVPYSINPIEATANVTSAYGYLQATDKKGIFIAMHGIISDYSKVKKDRTQGKFIL